MHRKFQMLALSLIVIVVGSYVIVAQTPMTGEWTATFKPEKENKVQLNFSRRSEKGGRNSHGSGFDLNDLQGLSAADLNAADVPVRFSLVREAGTIEAEGRFQNGKGSGTYRFTPNQNFASAMQNRGFAFKDDHLFSATMLNLTTSFVDDLKSVGFQNLQTDDLFKAVIFKVTPQFMSEMASIGFPNLDMEDLVKARIFKIDAEYARDVRAMGFSNANMEDLTKLRIFKVTPEFLREVQAEGLTNLSVEDATKLRIFKIDGAFIRQAKAENVPLNVETLVQKKIGVYRSR
jgi:hypothetical protein